MCFCVSLRIVWATVSVTVRYVRYPHPRKPVANAVAAAAVGGGSIVVCVKRVNRVLN